jgi:hypothetical protein
MTPAIGHPRPPVRGAGLSPLALAAHLLSGMLFKGEGLLMTMTLYVVYRIREFELYLKISNITRDPKPFDGEH